MKHVSELRLPIGPDAGGWLTVTFERTVLAVVHNVTALTRLVDVLGAFDSDPRVQIVFTVTGSSAFEHGLAEQLGRLGCFVIPWEQAVGHRFDLAITASKGGDLHEIDAPLVIVPHGLGYNKYLAPGSREPGAGSREPGAGSREPGAGSREAARFWAFARVAAA